MEPFENLSRYHPVDSKKASEPVDYHVAHVKLEIIKKKESQMAQAESLATNPSPSLAQVAQKHDYFGFSDQPELVHQVLGQLQSQYEQLGFSLDGIEESEIKDIKSQIQQSLALNEEQQSLESTSTLKNRLAELQQTNLPLSQIIQTLKNEFVDSLDSETSEVLEKFSL